MSVEYDSLPANDVKRGYTDLVRLGLDGGGPQQLLHTPEPIGFACSKQDAANIYLVQEGFDHADLLAVDKMGAGAKLLYEAPRGLDLDEYEIDARFVAWVEGDSGLNRFALELQNRCTGVVDTLTTTDGVSMPRHLALGPHHLFWVDGPNADATIQYVSLP